MRITRPRATKLSQITIDADIDLGAHSLKVSTIEESVVDAGIAIDGVAIKDANIVAEDITFLWDISKRFWYQSFSVASEETELRDIFFDQTGAKMYLVGVSSNAVHEYDLSTPWDISSAVWLQLFSVLARETSATGVFFDPTGTKMYIIGAGDDEVNEYDLGTPWDISSAVWLQLFDVSGEEINPAGLFFKPDGAVMYIVGDGEQGINEYHLSTPWDISSAIWVLRFVVSAQETVPGGIFFDPTGAKMFISGSQADEVNEYDL